MMHYPARFHGASDSSYIKRKHDVVRFVDLNFLLDWTDFFSKVMDKQMQLGVKGPHTNHCFIFEARDVTNEDSSSFRQVVTSCKRFMSVSGKEVPMILPDLTSSHWKDFKKLGKKHIVDYDPDNCSSEINELIQSSVRSSTNQPLNSDMTLLGLRCFKISNELHHIFNICQKKLHEDDIRVAPFEAKIRAHMVFDYCDHIRNDTDRFSVEEKQEILDFMLLNFPSKLVNLSSGFSEKAAEEFVKRKYGNYVLNFCYN